jgi:hypothetical protein
MVTLLHIIKIGKMMALLYNVRDGFDFLKYEVTYTLIIPHWYIEPKTIEVRKPPIHPAMPIATFFVLFYSFSIILSKINL